MSFSDFLFGKQSKTKKLNAMSPEQHQFLSQLMNMLSPEGQLGQGFGGALNLQSQLMDPSSAAVQQFSQPYINEFEQQTVPGLAERFAGMGAMGGGLSSSGFGQSLSAAGGNLQAQLAQLKAGLGQQAGQSLMNQYGQMSQLGLGAKPFGYMHRPGSPGYMAQLAGAYMSGGMPGMGG